MKKVKMIYVILLFSSCVTMKHQLPSITKQELPKDCNNLHSFINENWYKHRNKRCHKSTFDVYKFCYDYKECILKLTKTQVKMLLGEPDKLTSYGEFQYIFDEDCSNNSLQRYYYIDITFKQDLVTSIERGEVASIE